MARGLEIKTLYTLTHGVTSGNHPNDITQTVGKQGVCTNAQRCSLLSCLLRIYYILKTWEPLKYSAVGSSAACSTKHVKIGMSSCCQLSAGCKLPPPSRESHTPLGGREVYLKKRISWVGYTGQVLASDNLLKALEAWISSFLKGEG